MKIILLEKKFAKNKRCAEKNYGCSYMVYPTKDISLCYVQATLEESGHEVNFFYYSSIEDIKNNLPQADIYILHSVYLSSEEDIAIGKVLAKKMVCHYGPSPTLHPELFLNAKKHFVARGEVEISIPSAINRLDSEGISYLRDGKVKHNKSAGIIKDLDSLPMPANPEDLVFKNPKLEFNNSGMIIASRGCTGQCTFCVPNSISWARELEWKRYNKGKPPVAHRSVPNIINEVKRYLKLGINYISFVDDQFIVSKTHALAFADMIKELKVRYGFLARCDRLCDEELIRTLSESGLKYVDLGVESFDQAILDDIKKNLTVAKVETSIELLNKNGVEPKLNIMFGTSPLESTRTIEQSVKQTLKLPVKYCMYSIATPYEGTEFYESAVKSNIIDQSVPPDPTRLAQIGYKHLRAREIETLTKWAYRRFYFRPKIVWHFLSSGRPFFLLKSLISFWKK